jgi:TPR repeat protein
MYATGNGVAKNEGVAVQRYTQSCDLGNGTACYALGVIYEIGAGAKSDGVKAQKFYQLACSRGNSVACESAKRPAQKAKKTWKLGIFGL